MCISPSMQASRPPNDIAERDPPKHVFVEAEHFSFLSPILFLSTLGPQSSIRLSSLKIVTESLISGTVEEGEAKLCN